MRAQKGHLTSDNLAREVFEYILLKWKMDVCVRFMHQC